MPSENITIKSKMNPSKFMGSAYAAGSSLEKRVGNNERKITSIKNILKIRKSNLAENLRAVEPKEEENNQNIGDRLRNIAQALGVIGKLFLSQLGFNKKQSDEERKNLQDAKRKAREAQLESQKGKGGIIPKAISTPALSFFDKMKKFFLNIVIGVGVMKIFKWLNDPANQEKIKSFSEFLTKYAPLIVGGLAAIALLPIVGGLAGLIGGIVKGIALLGGLIPALPWILSAAAVAAIMVVGANKLKNWTAGGPAFREAIEAANAELNAAGVGQPDRPGGEGRLLNQFGTQVMISTGPPGDPYAQQRDAFTNTRDYKGELVATEEQLKAFEKWKKKIAILTKLKDEMYGVVKGKEEKIKDDFNIRRQEIKARWGHGGSDPNYGKLKSELQDAKELKKLELQQINDEIKGRYNQRVIEMYPQDFNKNKNNNLEIDSSQSSGLNTDSYSVSLLPSNAGVGGMMKIPPVDSSSPTSQGIEGSRSGSGLSKFSSAYNNKYTVSEESIYFS